MSKNDGDVRMDSPSPGGDTGAMTNTTNPAVTKTDARADGGLDDPAQLRRVRRRLERRSFAMLSTVSPSGFPHAAGVVYELVDDRLYVHTMRSSRKARNIAADPRVAVVVPDRRMPVGPPFSIQFQARAGVVAMDAPEILALLDAGRLGGIAGHGALDEPDGCFLRILPNRMVHTYGIGVSALAVARDPLHVGPRSVTWVSEHVPR